jgi:hypothetical protein
MGPGDLDGGCCNNPAMRPRHFSPPILQLKCCICALTSTPPLGAVSVHLVLADGALPRLREVKVSTVSLG